MLNQPSGVIPREQDAQQTHVNVPEDYPPVNYMSTVSPKWFDFVRLRYNLPLFEKTTLLASLSILVSFFLPWLSSPSGGYSVVNAGWRIAVGFPDPRFLMFEYLWLVPLSAGGMVVIVWLLGRAHLLVRSAAAMTIIFSLVALFVQLGFFVHVMSLQANLHAENFPMPGYGLLWGFWLAGVATTIALGANLWALKSCWLDDQGAPQDGQPGLARFWRNLGVSGQTKTVASLVLLLCFSLPWYATPDFNYPLTGKWEQLTSSYSGWNTAASFSDPPYLIFPQLWLIPLSAGGILIVLCLLGTKRLSARLIAAMTITLSLVALLVQLGFLVQVLLLQMEHQAVYHTATPGFNVLWGFWLSAAVSAAMVAIGIRALKPRTPPPDDIELSRC